MTKPEKNASVGKISLYALLALATAVALVVSQVGIVESRSSNSLDASGPSSQASQSQTLVAAGEDGYTAGDPPGITNARSAATRTNTSAEASGVLVEIGPPPDYVSPPLVEVDAGTDPETIETQRLLVDFTDTTDAQDRLAALADIEATSAKPLGMSDWLEVEVASPTTALRATAVLAKT